MRAMGLPETKENASISHIGPWRKYMHFFRHLRRAIIDTFFERALPETKKHPFLVHTQLKLKCLESGGPKFIQFLGASGGQIINTFLVKALLQIRACIQFSHTPNSNLISGGQDYQSTCIFFDTCGGLNLNPFFVKTLLETKISILQIDPSKT